MFKWVLIVKFSDGTKYLAKFDTMGDVTRRILTINYEGENYKREPVKITIERMFFDGD